MLNNIYKTKKRQEEGGIDVSASVKAVENSNGNKYNII